MVLKVYNTLTRKKEAFKPLVGKRVHMYVCGPTVYDVAHLGHARSYVAFDMISRYLQYKGYKVTYVQNLTDVDDKIIKRAKEEGVEPLELSKKHAVEFLKDMDSIGVKRSDMYPKPSEHIEEMQTIIKGLIEKGYAYESGGDVYYSVKKFKNYGKFSGQKVGKLEVGARVEPSPLKKDPRDFSMWKRAKKGEISWDSPWGKGRPSWHIECSAMSIKYLGPTLDIHGGGQDLIFPHHSNEIAQSEAYTGKKFANYWVHNGFVTVNKAKMSKSLKNFSTIRELLERYKPITLRFFLLSTHYRSPIDFADKYLQQAEASLEKLLNTIDSIKHALKVGKDAPLTLEDKKTDKALDGVKKDFIAAMDDDFNTPIAMAKLFDLSKLMNKYVTKKPNSKVLRKALDIFNDLDSIFNVINLDSAELEEDQINDLVQFADSIGVSAESKNVDSILKEIAKVREKSRESKDYKKSDMIRAKLDEIGIVLEDTKKGIKWRVKR